MSTHTDPIDFDALLEMLGGDKMIIASLLKTFLDELSAGVEEVRRALDSDDREAGRQLAHRIKGTSANLQASPLSAAARALELACAEEDGSGLASAGEALVAEAERLTAAIESWLEAE